MTSGAAALVTLTRLRLDASELRRPDARRVVMRSLGYLWCMARGHILYRHDVPADFRNTRLMQIPTVRRSRLTRVNSCHREGGVLVHRPGFFRMSAGCFKSQSQQTSMTIIQNL